MGSVISKKNNGSKIFIAPNMPGVYNQAGFEAIDGTFIEIDEVTDLGEIYGEGMHFTEHFNGWFYEDFDTKEDAINSLLELIEEIKKL